jgi:hypothetical protein
MADQIYVIGSLIDDDREMAFVPNGDSTDLPAGAQFAYSSAFTKFPYSEYEV